MADFSSHKPGTFSWPELSTTDQKGGVTFYRALFGWDLNDVPMGPGDTYSIFQMRGKSVGSAYTMRPDERSMGIPPHWNSYVTVASADQSAAKAKSLGGTVIAPPFDVMDAGRMAVIQDPTGAMFCVWEPKKHNGAGVLGENGSLCWTELMTGDAAKAKAFYTGLFGWTAEEKSMGPGFAYTTFSNRGAPAAGMMQLTQEMAHIPPNWGVYFAVADTDATVAKATSLGGKTITPATEVPGVGRFAILQDPQGAVFAVIKLSGMA